MVNSHMKKLVWIQSVDTENVNWLCNPPSPSLSLAYLSISTSHLLPCFPSLQSSGAMPSSVAFSAQNSNVCEILPEFTAANQVFWFFVLKKKGRPESAAACSS